MAKGKFGGGTGTIDDPFLVEDSEDLLAIDKKIWENIKYCFAQTTDIDLSGVDWKPICTGSTGPPLTGIYDGRRNKIKGLKIDTSNESMYNVGLFGLVVGGIKNTVVVDAVIDANDSDVGVLAGSIVNGAILESCSIINPIVRNNGLSAGALAGNLSGCTVNKCEAINVDISANEKVGGFSGVTQYSSITDCCVTGKIKVNQNGNEHIAPYAGPFGDVSSTFKNCYSDISITGRNTGGVLGNEYSSAWIFSFADDEASTVESCYANGETLVDYVWDAGTIYIVDSFILGTDNKVYVTKQQQPNNEWDGSGYIPLLRARPISGFSWNEYWELLIGSSSNPHVRTLDQMKLKTNYQDWDFENTWQLTEGSLPMLRFETRVKITCKRVPLTNYRR